MNNLTQAIEELRRVTPADDPWNGADISDGNFLGPTSTDKAVATILNAVLSNDLIPKADAEAAMAQMLDLAAIKFDDWVDDDASDSYQYGVNEGYSNAGEYVRAPALASALAELRVLRDERDRLTRAAECDAIALRIANKHVESIAKSRDIAWAKAEAAEAKVAHLEAHIEGTAKDTHKLLIAAEAEIATLRAQAEKLTGAVAWYGEQARLSRLIYTEGDIGRQSLAADGGKRARAALTEGAAP